MLFTGEELSAMVGTYFWPFVRIAAMISAMPVFSSNFIPVRVRLILAIALTVVIAPVIPPVPVIDALSLNGVLLIIQQLLIGVSMGFIFHIVFAAFTIGGQIVAMQMGLGFSTMVDPVNGSHTPVLSMFYILLVTLLFFILNGHLVMIGVIAQSFNTMPIDVSGMAVTSFWEIVIWGKIMFVGAILISLPAVTALLFVNMSLGLIGRAAPQLNIFAVGFSITITAGFVALMMSMPVVVTQFENISLDAFKMIKSIPGIQ